MTEDQYSPLVPDQKYLNEVKYSSRDFVSIADDLLRRLKVEYEEIYNDYATTSQGIMLRDLCAWAYAALTWYLDRTASDCFLATARTRAAVERLVEQIGYKMAPAAAGSTTLTLTFPNGTAGPFDMKDRWRYRSTSGFQYESYAKLVQPTALNPGDTVSVDVRQGETRTLTYTSDGTKNQTYRLASITEDRFLGANNIEAWVDGLLWEEKDFLEFNASNQNHYEVSYLANPPIVRFGDGLAGNVPPAGAEVKIRFLIIDGERGSVTSNSIQTSIDTLVVAGEAVAFTVNNTGPAKGRDPERAESAKRWAPVSFAARGAAITQQDYEAIANSFVDPAYGGVSKAYALNPRAPYDDIVFNELKSDIEDILSGFNANIAVLEAALDTNSDEMDELLLILTGVHTAIDTYRAQAASWAGSADSGARDAMTNVEIAEARSTIAEEQSGIALTAANSLKALIQAGGTDTDQMLLHADEIIYATTSASEEAQGARAAAGGAKSRLYNSVLPYTRDLMSYLQDGGEIEIQLDTMSTATSGMSTVVSDVQAGIASIEGEGEAAYNTCLVKLVEMQNRIGDLFSDDCLSNYVQVPILSNNLDGNYVAPSIGLRAALQAELDSIKEVTQVVEVVDGSPCLLGADIRVRLSVQEGAVPSEVVSQIRSVIVRLLKRRDFNSPLYLDSLYDSVSPTKIPGIGYVNIVITGPMSDIDDEGNLVPDRNKVIVFGSLDIKDPDGNEIR